DDLDAAGDAAADGTCGARRDGRARRPPCRRRDRSLGRRDARARLGDDGERGGRGAQRTGRAVVAGAAAARERAPGPFRLPPADGRGNGAHARADVNRPRRPPPATAPERLPPMTISTPPAPAGPRPRRPRRMRDELRELTVRLHFLAGLFITPFLLVTAVTGILYALTPQIEQMVYAEELHAAPCAQAEATPLAQQIRAGQAAVPDGTVAEIRPAPEAGSTARVSFESPSAPEDRRLTAFVDPCTGEVTWVLPTFGEWLPLRTWFDDLHRNLHLGDAGRWYSEVAASWLWVLALSGLAVWLTRKRRKRSLRALLLAQRTGPRRQRAVSLHATLGVWAALGLFFLSATGLTWSQYAGGNVGALRQSLDWSTPSVSTQAHAGAPVAPVGEQRVPEVAQHMLEDSRAHGLADPVAITPGADGGAWVVSQVQRSWPLQQDSVSLDPATGQVLDSVRFEDWPVAAKFAEAGIA